MQNFAWIVRWGGLPASQFFRGFFVLPGCELLETAKKRFLLNLRKSSAFFLCKTEKSPRGTPRGLLLFRFYSCAGSAERVMPCCASSRAVR